MICKFKLIELVSDKDIYVLKNSSKSVESRSSWSISKYDDEKQLFSRKRNIDPNKRQELNDTIHDHINYRAISDDESVLCLYMPSEVLSHCIGKIESLLK